MPTKEKILVILVNFSDKKIVNSEQVWSNAFFGDSGNTVKTYFKENSGGQFYFEPATETQGIKNNGVISVTLNCPHPNTKDNTDDRNRIIVKDALIQANSYIDFSQFDTNRNGYIETKELHIVTIIAGYEYSYKISEDSVWAHEWSFFDSVPAPLLDGKYVGQAGYGAYTQQGELHGDHMATIGTICHELAHSLGLPDLYNTTNKEDDVIGVTSLMCSGNWGADGGYPGSSPAHLDAWSKSYVGFETPVTLGINSGIQTLYAATTEQYNIVKLTTSNPKEYFLLENRNLSGFDSGMKLYGIYESGIAIWHIDEAVIEANMYYNTVNNNPYHRGVDLELADSLDSPFYRLSNGGTFSNVTVPNSKLYDGTATNVDVKVLSEASTDMNVQIGEEILPYKCSIASPQEGSTISGTIDVGGWYIYGKTITKIEILVDDKVAGEATRFARSDVTRVYPTYYTENAGFIYSLNTTEVANGAHTIKIKAYGEDKTTHITSRNVTVINAAQAKTFIAGDIHISTIEEEQQTEEQQAEEQQAEEQRVKDTGVYIIQVREQNIELEVGLENIVWYLCGENIEKIEVLKNADVVSETTQTERKEEIENQIWFNSKMKVFTYELLDSEVSSLDEYILVFKVYYEGLIVK